MEDVGKIIALLKDISPCPGVARHKDWILGEQLLKKHNIEVFTLIQEEGDLIVTHPFGYHQGYNREPSVNMYVFLHHEHKLYSKLTLNLKS